MRIHSYLIGTVAAMVFLGCQDGNGLIVPDHAPTTPTFVKNSSDSKGMLILNAEVSSGYGNVHEIVYDLVGSIRYSLVEDGGKGILDLSIDATLTEKNANGEVKKIQSETTEFFEAFEEVTKLSKEFTVDESPGGLNLLIEFKISGTSINVQSVSLIHSSEFGG